MVTTINIFLKVPFAELKDKNRCQETFDSERSQIKINDYIQDFMKRGVFHYEDSTMFYIPSDQIALITYQKVN
jgi:hypothetical protein